MFPWLLQVQIREQTVNEQRTFNKLYNSSITKPDQNWFKKTSWRLVRLITGSHTYIHTHIHPDGQIRVNQ